MDSQHTHIVLRIRIRRKSTHTYFRMSLLLPFLKEKDHGSEHGRVPGFFQDGTRIDVSNSVIDTRRNRIYIYIYGRT
jgi:hypothetical protein